jgi:hypothetical protein
VDAANNKLRAIAPVIREHGIEYERCHFQRKLGTEKVGLTLTEEWIRHTVSRVIDTNDARVSREGLVAGTHRDYEAVLHVGMSELVAEYPHWGEPEHKSTEDAVPETLGLDALRIRALNAHFHADVLSAVILVTADQVVKQRVRDAATRAQVLCSVSEAVMGRPPKPHNARYTVDAVMNVLVGAILEQDLAGVRGLIEKHVNRTHAVYAYMVSELHTDMYGTVTVTVTGCV